MTRLSRREFLRIAGITAGGLALTALTHCTPAEVPTAPVPAATDEDAEPTPTTQAPPSPEPTATATRVRARRMMSENREGWYIRYIQAIEPVDVKTWWLSVDGLVDNPVTLNFDDIQAFPEVTQRSRMKCVEGWSVAAEWFGFRPQTLVDLVKPKPEATWVHFHCADDYDEAMELGELLMDRVLFAYGANGAPLEPEYGRPLRLIVPAKYGYKGPKAITRITFSDQERKGYWSRVGPYTADGHIVAGVDFALDLETYKVFEKMGELFYEEGLESSGG